MPGADTRRSGSGRGGHKNGMATEKAVDLVTAVS